MCNTDSSRASTFPDKPKDLTTVVVRFVFALPVFSARATIVTLSEQSGGHPQAEKILHISVEAYVHTTYLHG